MTTRLPRGPASIVEAAVPSRRSTRPSTRRRSRQLKLLVRELATNSVCYGDREDGEDRAVGLRVVVDREVTDSGPGFESRPRRPEHEKGSGWVLHLVEHVPNRWGTTRTRPCVWFEIDLEGDDRADGAAPTAGQGASEGVHAA